MKKKPDWLETSPALPTKTKAGSKEGITKLKTPRSDATKLDIIGSAKTDKFYCSTYLIAVPKSFIELIDATVSGSRKQDKILALAAIGLAVIEKKKKPEVFDLGKFIEKL